jgi:hypothetical protein
VVPLAISVAFREFDFTVSFALVTAGSALVAG